MIDLTLQLLFNSIITLIENQQTRSKKRSYRNDTRLLRGNQFHYYVAPSVGALRLEEHCECGAVVLPAGMTAAVVVLALLLLAALVVIAVLVIRQMRSTVALNQPSATDDFNDEHTYQGLRMNNVCVDLLPPFCQRHDEERRIW